jgi:hypothetical protein
MEKFADNDRTNKIQIRQYQLQDWKEHKLMHTYLSMNRKIETRNNKIELNCRNLIIRLDNFAAI